MNLLILFILTLNVGYALEDSYVDPHAGHVPKAAVIRYGTRDPLCVNMLTTTTLNIGN